jgi:hypothetical protein
MQTIKEVHHHAQKDQCDYSQWLQTGNPLLNSLLCTLKNINHLSFMYNAGFKHHISNSFSTRWLKKISCWSLLRYGKNRMSRYIIILVNEWGHLINKRALQALFYRIIIGLAYATVFSIPHYKC